MKCSKRSFAVVSLLFAVLLSLLFAVLLSLLSLVMSARTLNARDADIASPTFAAAQTAKQQCRNV
jgi:Tfp pilus assembly protein PilW